MNNNPFTPVFGKVPPFLAGRQDVIDPIIEALEEGTNSPDIASLLVGARGMGKTALLQYLSFEAEQRGWVSANVTAETGMLGDIIQRCKESAQHLVGHSAKKRVTGVQVAGLAEINWDYPDSDKANWRTKMNT
ncbi:MAG: ATP-binding protein, partial [Eggerthellaceae bacterium]|nr:ATP-binding protein [Eggerthellaceae bacterium]